MFSTDRGRWYPSSRFLRLAAVRDGAFQITGLPFGTYYVAAVNALPPEGEDAWQSPDFLDTLSRRAESVTIRDGEKTALRLGR